MAWLPRFSKSAERPSLWRKDATTRRATGIQYGQYGRPYLSNWDPQRAVTDGYDRVVWVFRCVDAIASNVAGLEFVIRKGHPVTGDIDPRHPLLPVLNRQANEFETSENFIYRLVSQYLLSKRGAYVEVGYTRDGVAARLTLLPPHWTNPIPDARSFVSGFRVDIPGASPVDVPAIDEITGKPKVLWIRKPHPLDPYSGVTPLESAGLSIDTDFYARLYNRRFLQNDGRPGGILAVGGDIDPEDAEELRRRFSGGPESAGRTSVIEAEAAEWIDTATTQRDSQYVESMNTTKESILLAFGVPESIIGNASGRTFDNAGAEKAIFWNETMLPHLRLIAGAFDPLDGSPDLYTAFDTSSVAVLNRDNEQKELHLMGLWQAGLISQDEFREATGRDPYDVPASRALWRAGGTEAVPKKGDEEALAPEPEAMPPGAEQAALPAGEEEPEEEPEFGIEDAIIEPTPDRFRVSDAIIGKSMVNADDIEELFATFNVLHEAKVLVGAEAPGVMVALFLDDDDARMLAVPGGESPEELHVTLAYIGKADQVNRDALEQAVAGFALSAPPLRGKVSGYGRFDVGSEHAVYASVDIPDLPEWRQKLIASLEAFGIKVNREHGYTPHVTLQYVAAHALDLPMPPRIPLAFDRVTVATGADRQSFVLKGTQAKSAITPKWIVPA